MPGHTDRNTVRNKADDTHRWPRRLILLHWTTGMLALAVALLAVVLLSPPDWSQPYVDRYMTGIGWHKLGGLLTLLLTIIWVAMRIFTPRPPRIGEPLHRLAAHLAHLFLLLLLILLPVSGYVMDALLNAQVELPAGVSLPSLLSRNEQLSLTISYAHKWAGFALLGLAALHIAAALAHTRRRGDQTLRRMMPGFLKRI